MEASEFRVFLYCHLGHKPFHLPSLCLILFLLFFCYCSFFVKQIFLVYHFLPFLFPFFVFLKNFKPFLLVSLRIITSTLIQKIQFRLILIQTVYSNFATMYFYSLFFFCYKSNILIQYTAYLSTHLQFYEVVF